MTGPRTDPSRNSAATDGVDVVDPALTLARLIELRAARTPDAAMLIESGLPRLSFAGYERATRSAACWLRERGVVAGMSVGWKMATSMTAVVLMGALARMGVRQAPIIHLARGQEIRSCVQVVAARVLIVENDTADRVDSVRERTRAALSAVPNPPTVIVIDPGDFQGWLAGEPGPGPVALSGNRLDAHGWTYFTSGSTGTPKGARHSDATILSAARGFVEHYRLGAGVGEVGSIPFPIGHIGGVVYLAALLLAGFPAVLFRKFEVGTSLTEMREHRVTVTGGGPVFYRMIIDARAESPQPLLPDLRMLHGGGAHCPEHLFYLAKAQLGVPIVHAYGMTECAMVCVATPDDSDEQLAHTEGRPVPGVRVRVVDAVGANLEPGEVGEVRISGDALFLGYESGDHGPGRADDGWFVTGDRGYLRTDGHLVLTGRAKDVIVRKGESISPQEIEAALLSLAAVDEVAVIGLPDSERGELVCAVVTLQPGASLDLAAIRAHLAALGLMPQKWPERLEILDELPITGPGKVSKRQLVERLSPL